MERETTSAAERLKAALREAERVLQGLNERLEDRPDLSLGTGSVGGCSWEMALARRRTTTARIEALRETLARVAEGTYGHCSQCGTRIDPQRLEILPEATLCAACARATRMPRGFAPGIRSGAATGNR